VDCGPQALLRSENCLHHDRAGEKAKTCSDQGSRQNPEETGAPMMRMSILLAAVAAAMMTATAQAETVGITDTSIKLGNTAAYSGPASSYGTIAKSIAAYFKKVNAEGGIHGRQIDFISLDDAYTPPRTIEQVRALVEREQVAALFMTLGTAANSAIHRYVNSKKVPHLYVGSGASKWGQPEEYPWSIGWQPAYPVEAKIYASYIMENHPDAKVAILYQNDDFGKDYLTGFLEAVGDKKSMIVSQLPYEVTDPTVDSQILQFKDSGANVFVNITTPKFAAQAIRKASETGWKPLQFLTNVSASVGSVLKPAGLENSQGIITAQYQMDPTDPQWQATQDYKDWEAMMEEYYPNGDRTDLFNVYGYSAAVTMHKMLEQCGRDIDRAKLMECATNMHDVRIPMLLPGITVSTSPTDFYPIEAMQLARFDGHIFKLFGDVIDASAH
jgi:branched-chain amino acid transport system substrate-binding protein